MWRLVALLACVPEAEKPDDADADGWSELAGDCDDADPARHPEAEERCDGVDQDCDGAVDEDPVDTIVLWVDADGDGVGGDTPVEGCDPEGVETTGDCDDGDAARHPGAEEICDTQVDEDCDGTAAGCVPEGDGALAAGLELGADGIDTFGATVIGTGDHTGDGLPDVIVAAPGRSAEADASTTPFVWVYDASTDGRLSSTQADAEVIGFESRSLRPGTALAGGDLDGDGAVDLVVGAPGHADGLYGYGAVFVLRGPVTGSHVAPGYPRERGYTGDDAGGTYEPGEEFDEFGTTVAVLPDLDGDGLAELGVGAPLAPSADGPEGAVYVFGGSDSFADRDATPLARVAGGEPWADAGRAILGLPDVDGDGYGELALGAPGRAESRGAVVVILRPAGSTSFDEADLRFEGPAPRDRAGFHLARDPDTGALTVGAPNDISSEPQDGVVWSVPLDPTARGIFSLADVASPVVVGASGEVVGAVVGHLDVDGDDAMDLLYGAPGLGGFGLWTASGLGWRLTGTVGSVGTAAHPVDADGDPFEDVLVGDPAERRAVVWRGRGL